MPFSSMARMREASVYRGGGWVKCWSGAKPRFSSCWPSVRGGRLESLSSFSRSSSLPSSYTAVKPENFRLLAEARKPWPAASASMETLSKTALVIWQATNRLQMRR